MSIFTSYSNEYYAYKDEYEKYREALEYVEHRLKCLEGNLSGLGDAVRRFNSAEITGRNVSGRPKSAYAYQHNKLKSKINSEVALFNSMKSQLYKERDAIKSQLNRYKGLRDKEKARCEKESEK